MYLSSCLLLYVCSLVVVTVYVDGVDSGLKVSQAMSYYIVQQRQLAAGLCESDIDVYCLDVMPGLGRLAICLSDQIKEQGKKGYTGSQVSQTCSQELDKFRQDQSGNINLDLPLGSSRLMLECIPSSSICRARMTLSAGHHHAYDLTPKL